MGEDGSGGRGHWTSGQQRIQVSFQRVPKQTLHSCRIVTGAHGVNSKLVHTHISVRQYICLLICLLTTPWTALFGPLLSLRYWEEDQAHPGDVSLCLEITECYDVQVCPTFARTNTFLLNGPTKRVIIMFFVGDDCHCSVTKELRSS